MMRYWPIAAAMLAISTQAAAHEVWIERDGAGPARIYLGEPADIPPPGGDPEFAKLVAPKLLSTPHGAVARRAGFLEVAVAPGDVRAWDDTVFQPWGPENRRENVVYYARAGRAEPRAAMPLEIVPLTANGDRFALLHDGKPVTGAKVTVIAPDRSTRVMPTDRNGAITVPGREAGRYLLTATVIDEGRHDTPGGPVAVLNRIATTSFVR